MKPKQALSRMLSDYQPRPGKAFYRRMKDAPWNKKETTMPDPSRRPARFAWQIAAACVLVLAILSFSIPPVRAALSAWLGLSVAPSNQMPAAPVTLVAVTPATPTAAAPTATPTAQTSPAPTETIAPTRSQTVGTPIPAEISRLSAQAGWDILAPGRLPEGYHFESAYYDANNKMVMLTYLVTRSLPGATDPSLTASTTITLLQALKNDFVPMQVAPATHVEDTRVNGQPAAYAVGAWDAEFVKDDKDPNGGKMVSTWRNDLPVQNLYWQAGSVYLVLVTNDEAVSKQAFIDMAASIGK